VQRSGSDGANHPQLTRALGEGVIRIWSNLPQEMQDDLFQEAVSSQGESIRSQLAIFLQTDRGFIVMEVNDNPNLEHGIEDQVGKDEIWVRVLKWFIERFEQ
jgi:hypothetical protein